MTNEVLDFERALRARGFETYVRNSRCKLWPDGAFEHGLTDGQREFWLSHQDELKVLVRSKALPETTVVWVPPPEVVAKIQAAKAAKAGRPVPDLRVRCPGPDADEACPDIARPNLAISRPEARGPQPNCPKCGGNRPCVGPGNRWFKVLHWDDPDVQAARNADATQVMLRTMHQPYEDPL